MLMPETERQEPTRLYRWMVLIFVSLAMFGNYYVYDCIAPVADLLAKQLGFSDSNIGLLQAIYSIPNVFMVADRGYIVDRIGTRKAIFIFGTLCFRRIDRHCFIWATQCDGDWTLNLWSGRGISDCGRNDRCRQMVPGKELSFAFGINLMIARFGTCWHRIRPLGPIRI